jgi:ABC-type branched-subunit amino acid transport system ATPase component
MIEAVDVTLTAVAKRYGSVMAVDSINLTVPKGTYRCLLGPSGRGKTTTLLISPAMSGSPMARSCFARRRSMTCPRHADAQL